MKTINEELRIAFENVLNNYGIHITALSVSWSKTPHPTKTDRFQYHVGKIEIKDSIVFKFF